MRKEVSPEDTLYVPQLPEVPAPKEVPAPAPVELPVPPVATPATPAPDYAALLQAVQLATARIADGMKSATTWEQLITRVDTLERSVAQLVGAVEQLVKGGKGGAADAQPAAIVDGSSGV